VRQLTGDDQLGIGLEPTIGRHQVVEALLGDQPAQPEDVLPGVQAEERADQLASALPRHLDPVGDHLGLGPMLGEIVGVERPGDHGRGVGHSEARVLSRPQREAGHDPPLGSSPVEAVDGGHDPSPGELGQYREERGAEAVVMEDVMVAAQDVERSQERVDRRLQVLGSQRWHGANLHLPVAAGDAVERVAIDRHLVPSGREPGRNGLDVALDAAVARGDPA